MKSKVTRRKGFLISLKSARKANTKPRLTRIPKTVRQQENLLRVNHGYYTQQVQEFEELVEETIPMHTDIQPIEGAVCSLNVTS